MPNVKIQTKRRCTNTPLHEHYTNTPQKAPLAGVMCIGQKDLGNIYPSLPSSILPLPFFSFPPLFLTSQDLPPKQRVHAAIHTGPQLSCVLNVQTGERHRRGAMMLATTMHHPPPPPLRPHQIPPPILTAFPSPRPCPHPWM